MAHNKQYNYCLDYIKGIACIFVVFMHCEFPGTMGTIVQAVGRFSVPLFFMVSGYFCFKKGTDSFTLSDSSRKIKHIGKITIFASIFYFCFFLIRQHLSGGISLSISNQQLFDWALFNNPVWVAGQYWFLYALLYTYVFFFAFELSGNRAWGYIFAAMMFAAYIILAQGLHIANIHIPNHIYRNWLVEGFAFFMLGHWIHNYQSSIKLSNNTLIAIIIIFTLLCLPERYLLGRDFGVNICTIPQVAAMFIFAVKNPTRHQGYIQLLGKNCSMFVYILHPAVWHTMEDVYKAMHMEGYDMALYLMPIIVLIITILLSMACNRLQVSLSPSKKHA